MGISTHSTKTSALHECTDDTNARVNPATITNSLTNSSPEQQQNQVAVAVENTSIDGKPRYSDAVKLPKKKQNHTDVPLQMPNMMEAVQTRKLPAHKLFNVL